MSGDTFGHAAMLSGLPPGFAARAAEDTLCYRIPDTVARPLLDSARRRELAVGRSDASTPVGSADPLGHGDLRTLGERSGRWPRG